MIQYVANKKWVCEVCRSERGESRRPIGSTRASTCAADGLNAPKHGKLGLT